MYVYVPPFASVERAGGFDPLPAPAAEDDSGAGVVVAWELEDALEPVRRERGGEEEEEEEETGEEALVDGSDAAVESAEDGPVVEDASVDDTDEDVTGEDEEEAAVMYRAGGKGEVRAISMRRGTGRGTQERFRPRERKRRQTYL